MYDYFLLQGCRKMSVAFMLRHFATNKCSDYNANFLRPQAFHEYSKFLSVDRLVWPTTNILSIGGQLG